MSTTTTTVGGGTITLTDEELGPYVTHAGTRRWLTGPGLPHESALLGFGALREGTGLRRVAELVADAGVLAQELRDQLVIGSLRTLDRDLESIVLDGTTGEISTTSFHRDPGLMDLSPLAPSLEALLRFAEATEELVESRGRFATFEGRVGPKPVAAMTSHLTSHLTFHLTSHLTSQGTSFLAARSESDEVRDLAPYWRMAALIRPLARIAGPGDGLALKLPPRLLDEEFGAGGIMRFEEVDFPTTLVHGPTRRFLTEFGLPEDGFMFQLDTEVALPTLSEYYAEERPGYLTATELPVNADRLIRLGQLLHDTSLVVDGTTGAILCWSEPDRTLRPLNADISTLAFTVWLIHREKALDARYDLTESYAQLAATMTETLATVDPIACDRTPTTPDDDGWRYWPGIFEDQTSGTLYA
ncbi:SUKH-4 family immunity protein [Streptomyces acidicola]|uniref:SUKH-4 family immunity protein n=1 Tax=Streptomyces acidicola TaxID=2596892 RepID=UPI003796298E